MATTTNFGWTTPNDTDLVKDGAAAIRTLGNGIDTSMMDLKGGTTGQILSKASNTDMDFTWIANDQGDITGVTAGTGISGGGTSGTVTITNSMATAIDAKGDLIAGTGADAFDRLAIGTNGQILTADSTASTGMKWATPSTGALTLISSTTFTGSSSHSVNDVFSSTYSRYLIATEISSVSATGYIRMRLRVSGSDNTSANYYWSNIYNVSNAITPTGEGGNAETSFGIGYLASGGGDFASNMNLNNPQATKYTTFSSQNARWEGSVSVLSVPTGAMSVTTSYTGFTIYPASGTFSGKVYVYGYSN